MGESLDGKLQRITSGLNNDSLTASQTITSTSPVSHLIPDLDLITHPFTNTTTLRTHDKNSALTTKIAGHKPQPCFSNYGDKIFLNCETLQERKANIRAPMIIFRLMKITNSSSSLALILPTGSKRLKKNIPSLFNSCTDFLLTFRIANQSLLDKRIGTRQDL